MPRKRLVSLLAILTLAQQSDVTITLESNDADTYLYFRDGPARSGAALSENDDDGDGTNSRIEANGLAAGTYAIEATTYGSGQADGFTLTVTGLSGTTPPGTDRAALVALYNATDGPNWTNNNNWLSDAPIGEWHGVTTDASGRVTMLNLLNNQLSGAMPPQLGNLASLTYLSLAANQLSGAIPPELGSLASLTVLQLWGNQLSGAIPPEFGGIASLRELWLGGNQLSGCVPASLQDVQFNDFDQLPFCGP